MDRLRTIVLLSVTLWLSGCSGNAVYQSNMPMDGWNEYKSKTVSMWLPSYFKGGEPDEILDKLIAQFEAAGPGYEAQINRYDELARNIDFYAIVIESGGERFKTGTNVLAKHSKLPLEYKTEHLINALAKGMPAHLKVVSTNVVQLQNYEAGRLIIKQETKNHIIVRQEMYLIQHDKSLWVVAYSCNDAAYVKMKNIFRISAGTIKLR